MHKLAIFGVLALVGAGLVNADGDTNSAVTVSVSLKLLMHAPTYRLIPHISARRLMGTESSPDICQKSGRQ